VAVGRGSSPTGGTRRRAARELKSMIQELRPAA